MPKVSPDVAVDEFERLAAAADVKVSTDGLFGEELDDLEETRGFFVDAITEGSISVNEDGCAVLATVEHGDIRFRVPLGEDLMILASSKEDRQMEALGRFVCAITGKDSRTVGRLRKKEWKIAMKIAGFLSAD